MSYCVNCGVELDASLKGCPLCGTPVYNPKEQKAEEMTFPKRMGEVEKISRRDQVVFASVMILTIVVTCSLLNGLVYNSVWWSVPVNGILLVLWVFYIAAVLVDKITVYAMLAVDALAIGGYLYIISRLTKNDDWLTDVGLPILLVSFSLFELFIFLGRRLPFSMLAGTLYFFITVAAICVTIEICVDLHFGGEISLSWSAIVLTVCLIMSVMVAMTLMMGRLRASVSRRLHF